MGKRKSELDIRKVPTEYIRFAWLTHIIDQFDVLIISEYQSEAIFSGNRDRVWKVYKGIPIEIK